MEDMKEDLTSDSMLRKTQEEKRVLCGTQRE